MRRPFLLAALCMAATLVFAPMAMAQSASSSASADPCPDPDFPRETPDGCQASNLPDVSTGSTSPDAGASASASASAAAGEDVDCADFASQFGAQQYYDFNSPPGDPYNLDADGDGIACEDSEDGGSAAPTAGEDDASANASASASDQAEELPETGGPGVAGILASMTLPALALLVAGGILAARLVRR